MALSDEIKKSRPFDSPEQEAMLSILRTADLLASDMADVLKLSGLSSTQYNALRILRGAGKGLPCGEIASRMITRDPDVTRLIDRLEKRKLVSRCREKSDRRVVCVHITDLGLSMLAQLDHVVAQAHRDQLGHMGDQRLKQLIALLDEVRSRAPH